MAQPTCLICGASIGSLEPQHYGRCIECLAELKKRPQALILQPDVLVRASYHPGFAEDLTTWDTFVSDSGVITQTIQWYRPVHGNASNSKQSTQLNGTQLTRLNELLAQIDLTCLAVFKCWMCVCDAPFVHLFSPCHNLHVTVDQFGLNDEDMPQTAKIGVRQFQTAWKFIDSISPYTTAEHYG